MAIDADTHADARPLVELVLAQAIDLGASDVHLEPTASGYELRFRTDGLLNFARRYDPTLGRSLVSRLMVMAQLLTYRLDVPQEGRIAFDSAAIGRRIDLRLAVMPTTHGLRAVVRLPAELSQPRSLETLGLPRQVLEALQRFAAADSGMLLLTGPAGSGKTTTIYALVQHIVTTSPGLSIIALEDPVERDLPGVTQIEVSPFGQLSYDRALRSILRQDPQVLVLGEIRDAATASIAVQAALSGHRLISSLHAGTPGGAVARLLEMGIEPYQIGSALHGVVAQRLLRRRAQMGYRGRLPVATFAAMDSAARAAVLRRADAGELDRLFESQTNAQTLAAAADDAVRSGHTDIEEVRRVLGQSAGEPR